MKTRARRPRTALPVRAAQDTQALLAAIVDSSEDAIYSGDMDGILLSWNAGAERLFGYAAGEIVGRSVALLYPRGADAELRRIMASVRKGEPPKHFEATRRRKDGSLVPVAMTVSPIRDAKGTIIGASVIARDITEARRAAEALRLSEERFHSLFMAVPAGIAVTDETDGRILEANDACARVFGYTRDQVIGRTTLELGVFADLADRTRLLDRFAAANPLLDVEVRMRAKSGAPLALRGWFHQIVIDGKPLVMSMFVDETQRVRTEEERRSAEQQYRELVDGVRDVVFSMTPRGVITSLNPAFEQITGMPPREWIGRRFAELIHPDDVERAARELGAAMRNEHGANPPLRIRTVGGGFRFGEVQVTPRMQDGRVTGLLGIGRDVSERVELESQFRQAQKMEAVGRLAGGVAHDFNNLLTVIIGSGQMVLGGMARDDQDRGDIELMVTAGERAAELTRQLLAFSRRQALQPRTLDLNAVLADVEKLLGRLVGDDIRLLTVPAAHLGFVRADPGQIEQVVANLVVNARDAMPTGGTLTIATKNVDLDEAFARSHPGAGTGPHVMLSVTDTGAGMSEDIKSRIFEPFFTTKESGKGTGLGLSTVYGIVQQSGGQIQVLSELGRGTCFEVYLPRVGATADGAEDVTALGTLHGSETVLVAEDDTIVRNLEVKVLRGYGYTILAAPNGASALRIAAPHPGPIDLLVTDLVMPEMGGRELSEHLAAIRPGLKTLYVSGYADDSADRNVPIGPDVDFIQKPFTPVSLGQKVREMLGPRR